MNDSWNRLSKKIDELHEYITLMSYVTVGFNARFKNADQLEFLQKIILRKYNAMVALIDSIELECNSR